MKVHEIIIEKWSTKYKRSINCNNPQGFSQKAHCAGRKKNEDVVENSMDDMSWPVIKKNKAGEKYVITLDNKDGELLVYHDNGKYMKLSPRNLKYVKQELGILENFADGKVKGKSRPGRVKRAGASCNGSVTDLRKRAKNSSGEKARMYHWCANMKSGRKKN